MPTTPSSRRNSHRNRRGSTPPTPGQNGSKLAGRIMWLPHADELSSSTGFADECHNHPVLVLSKKMGADGKVDILMMTSFGGQDLEAKHRYSKVQLRGTFLPIDPSPPHPDNNIQLKLDHGVTLRKNSYVKTEEQRKILFSHLRNYERHNNKVYALTKASYQIVVEHCGYREPVHSPAVTITPPRQPVARPQPQPERVPSYGYGTIPTSQPYPASRPVQNTQSGYNGYFEDRSNSFWNPDANSQRKRRPTSPFRHVSGGSQHDLSPSAQAVLGLIFIAIFACGAAGVYWLLKMFFSWISEGIKHFFEGLQGVDWHEVFNAIGLWLWDVVVNLGKVVKYLVVMAAKGVAWVAKSAWGLVRDVVMGAPKEKLF
ncbi:hypothetical protein SMACR_08216 [Sordaria macrospora]|uniref:WGS project CABT00000000 data, contig 2.43 n=2 Tax=Sordaria macrospora TaxID=5147 RepID=F7W868_SORMK|nr:uncharacterized protein SMAC_08216 [Sordaria macrospora k-hell]KAA8624303.1 hypothetical protein SMACR_08216 [Sordaria macrospora]WPJ61103.1 hypothetical protein SMAC4_08216 [Sordaria macrospora]CCC13713.1 unnamed protein product [Sordaria macrospora k-hell]